MLIAIACVGSSFSYMLYYKHTKSEQKQKLKHVRKIISDDFYQIYAEIELDIQLIVKILNDKKTLDVYAIPAYNEIEINDRFDRFFNFSDYKFRLWDAVITSGTLILLEPYEIQMLYSSQKQLSGKIYGLNKMFEKQAYHFKKMGNDYQRFYEYDEFEKNFKRYLGRVKEKLISIQDQIRPLNDEIDWMVLEFSSYKMKMLNTNYISSK